MIGATPMMTAFNITAPTIKSLAPKRSESIALSVLTVGIGMNNIEMECELGSYCIWREYRALKPLPMIVDTGVLIVSKEFSFLDYKGPETGDVRTPSRKWIKAS